jgi:hypothetical protein
MGLVSSSGNTRSENAGSKGSLTVQVFLENIELK